MSNGRHNSKPLPLKPEIEERWRRHLLSEYVRILDEIAALSGGVTWPGEPWIARPQYSVEEATRLGAILRGLLTEGANLHSQVRQILSEERDFREVPLFMARVFEMRPGKLVPSDKPFPSTMLNDELEDLRNDVPAEFMVTTGKSITMKLNQWLKHPVGNVDEYRISVADLISLAANLHGGVHYKQPTTKKEARIFELAIAVMDLRITDTQTGGSYPAGPLYGLRAVGRITYRGLFQFYEECRLVLRAS